MSDNFNLARLKKGAENFEVVVDAEKAVELKNKRTVDVREALVYPKIFSDAKKGMQASEQRMKQLFGTSSPEDVARIIITEGSIQLTAEYRQKQLELKKKRLIEMIHRNGVDPRTKAPHPITRIENAFEQAKIKIDEFKSPELQLNDVIKQLMPIIPIKFVVKEIAVTIPAVHAGKAYSAVKSFGKILRENWLSDGSWDVLVEIPGGMETEFYDRINKVTQGSVMAKVVEVRG